MRPSDAARLVLLGAIWGSSFLFIKIALEDLAPFQIVAGRIVIGAALLVGLLYARGDKLPRDREVLRILAVMAVIANIVPFMLITWGEQHISSSLTAILNSTTPLFTVLIASLVLSGESLRPMRFGGVAVSPPTLTAQAVACVLALGLAGTGWAYVLYYRLISDIGATSASFVTYLIPVFGIALGALVLGEELGWNTFVGAALVIAGIALSEVGGRRSAPTATCAEIEVATESSGTTTR